MKEVLGRIIRVNDTVISKGQQQDQGRKANEYLQCVRLLSSGTSCYITSAVECCNLNIW